MLRLSRKPKRDSNNVSGLRFIRFLLLLLYLHIFSKKRSKGMNDFFHFLFILCFLVWNRGIVVISFSLREPNCSICLGSFMANIQNQRSIILLGSSPWWSFLLWSGEGHIPTSSLTAWKTLQSQRREDSILSVIEEYVCMGILGEPISRPKHKYTYQVILHSQLSKYVTAKIDYFDCL